MLRWFRKSSTSKDFHADCLLEADNFQTETRDSLPHLTARLADLEQTLQSVSKTLRRVHLSSDQNFSMLREVQCKLKEMSNSVQQPEDSYIFSEAELLEFLDSSTNNVQPTHNAHRTLLHQLNWQAIATIDQNYHPLHCEIIEAVEDGGEPGLVRHILQQGYFDSEGKILRRAKVIVSKNRDFLVGDFENSEALTL
jgi:molecular chaperone GrpE (heat shock protein)